MDGRTPHRGARIEMPRTSRMCSRQLVAPHIGVRGLKFLHHLFQKFHQGRTPHRGARIEMKITDSLHQKVGVAPHIGVRGLKF